MPIYEYLCKACGNKLDALQKISDPPLQECPECERPALKKLVSAPNFRLKGSGWYETDFKQDKKRNVIESESDSSGKEKKTEKPEAGKASDKKDNSGDKKKTKTGSGDQAA